MERIDRIRSNVLAPLALRLHDCERIAVEALLCSVLKQVLHYTAYASNTYVVANRSGAVVGAPVRLPPPAGGWTASGPRRARTEARSSEVDSGKEKSGNGDEEELPPARRVPVPQPKRARNLVETARGAPPPKQARRPVSDDDSAEVILVLDTPPSSP